MSIANYQHRRGRRVAGILLVAFAGIGLLLWPQISDLLDRAHFRPYQTTFEGVEIRGSEIFVGQVKRSLVLLRDKCPDAFNVVQQFVKRIREHDRSGMRAYANPPTFDLSLKSANYSPTWCAGAIAHDAYHSKLYHDYRDAHGEPVPDDAWCGKAKEKECIEFQIVAMHAIGAPSHELHHLSKQDGSHFDVDGDGTHTWNDNWQQNW